MSSTCEAAQSDTASSSSAMNEPQPSLEELRERYLEQQRRLACPACGEEPFVG